MCRCHTTATAGMRARHACVCVWASVRVYWQWYWFVSKFNDNSPVLLPSRVPLRRLVTVIRWVTWAENLFTAARTLERRHSLQRRLESNNNKKRQSEPETESDSVVWSPLFSVCLSVWRGSLRLASALQQFSVFVYVCTCTYMCLYVCTYVCIQTIKWPYGQYKMKLILCTLHDIIFMDYLFMHVDINLIAFIEMYYYTLQPLKMCENKGVFILSRDIRNYAVQGRLIECNLVPAWLLYFHFSIEHIWSFHIEQNVFILFSLFLLYSLQLNFHITAGIKRLNTGPEACF